MKYLIRAASLILIIAVCVSAQPKPFGGMNVSKIDETNHRIFVAPSTAFLTTLKTTREYLDMLSAVVSRQYPEWGSKWVVSFFSEPRYATYKDDEQVLPAVKDGTWAKAYLAEYDNNTRILAIAPIDPSSRRTSKLE